MEQVRENRSDEAEIRRVFSRLNALYCIKVLIVLETVIKMVKILAIAIVLYVEKGNQANDQTLRLFLVVYSFLCFFKTITFLFKNKSFFYINQIPEYEENADIALANNILEATMLFWYIVGFHCIQECDGCKQQTPYIYNLTLICVCLGFFSFIAPLLAIIMLLFLISYLKPKLTSFEYHTDMKLPNNTKHCTICYDEYTEGSLLKILPCDHHFHSDCIDEWISFKENCPLCKKNINILYDIVEGDDGITV